MENEKIDGQEKGQIDRTKLCMDMGHEEQKPTKEQEEFLGLKKTQGHVIVKPEPFSVSTVDMKMKGMDNWNLTKNEKNEKSFIAMYTLLRGNMYDFDHDDPFQEILFMPIDEKGNKILKGELEITLECATGETVDLLYKQDISCMHSVDLHEKRKWQGKMLGVAGDIIKVYFTSEKEFNPKNSVLLIRIRRCKIVDMDVKEFEEKEKKAKVDLDKQLVEEHEKYEMECDITGKKLNIYKDDLWICIVLNSGDVELSSLDIGVEALKEHEKIFEKLKELAEKNDKNIKIEGSKYIDTSDNNK